MYGIGGWVLYIGYVCDRWLGIIHRLCMGYIGCIWDMGVWVIYRVSHKTGEVFVQLFCQTPIPGQN